MALLAMAFNASAFVQTLDHSNMATTKTVTFEVGGKCDMCKTRIEKAAKIEGVIQVDWNRETKILTLTYNPSVVTSDNVQKNIAAAGHDTVKFRADDKVYSSLPACCHYDRIN